MINVSWSKIEGIDFWSTYISKSNHECMKKSLLIIVMSTLYNYAFSQMNGDFNYTLAVKGYSVMQMPKVLNQKSTKDFTNVWFTGAMVKFNDNQFSYRLSGNYVSKNIRLINNCATCEAAEGKMTDYIFKIGFEKNINFSHIQPYFGFDIGFRSNKFNGTAMSNNPAYLAAQQGKAVGDVSMEPSSVEATKIGFVASPVIGIKINPIPQLSIYAEGNLDYFASYERQETVSGDLSNTVSLRKYNKTEFLINPVTIGIQIHLGSNR